MWRSFFSVDSEANLNSFTHANTHSICLSLSHTNTHTLSLSLAHKHSHTLSLSLFVKVTQSFMIEEVCYYIDLSFFLLSLWSLLCCNSGNSWESINCFSGRKRESVCVWERERESVYVWVSEWERERTIWWWCVPSGRLWSCSV